MKLDLDELERKANAAIGAHGDAAWRVARCHWAGLSEACGIKDWPFVSAAEDSCQQGVVFDTNRDECQHHMTLTDAEHIAASSPPVTLALIARIRELEGELDAALDGWANRDHDGPMGEDSLARDQSREILVKGAVMP